nr:hypothetical protein [uncultured Draconibacterium sp.]
MKRLIHFNSLVIALLALSIQLHAQFKNKNEYIKLNEELYCQYSPIEKGWAIFKFDNKSQTYNKQEYTESPDIKKSYFENIYVVGDREFYTYNGKAYKPISGYSNEIYSSEYKELLIYNSPQADKDYPHTVGLTFENKYISLHDRPMSCDTFLLQNGTFFPIFKKDNPKISENIFTQNGLIVPALYGNSGYSYTIRKTSQGYILSDRKIMIPQMGYLIHSYPEMGYAHKNPELNKLFKPGINLSYYDGKNFLISEKNKWYICKVSANETDFNDYLTDLKRVLPQNETLYQYFGTIEANSITVLTWNSGKPEYFVANINGIDYLYDYRKAAIKNINKNITFPIGENISGDYIRAYYPPDVYRDFKPMYIEVNQGNKLYFYKYVSNEFKNYDKNPFIGHFKSTFIGSSYKEFDNSGQIISEKTFKACYTPSELEAEIKRQAEEERLVRQKKLEEEELQRKKTIQIFQDFEKETMGRRNNCFPKKYYDGTQFFFKENDENVTVGPFVVVNNTVKKLNILSSEAFVALGESGSNEEFQIIASGISGGSPDHDIRLYSASLPNIKSNLMQTVDLSVSSYDKSLYLTTRTYLINDDYANYRNAKNIKLDEIFSETGKNYKYPIRNLYFMYDNVDFSLKNALRLSNNNILLVWENRIDFLSNQMNSAFGIDGYGNISRTFKQAKYYKFLVISEDGSRIIWNKNFLLPESNRFTLRDFIISVDGGFILCMSPNEGNLVSLDLADFGVKKTKYSAAAGKNIIVTENINLYNNTSNVEGIKLYKFDNNCNLQLEKTIDEANDKNISLSKLYLIYAFDDQFVINYTSYHANIINKAINVAEFFDFDLNSISKQIIE